VERMRQTARLRSPCCNRHFLDTFARQLLS